MTKGAAESPRDSQALLKVGSGARIALACLPWSAIALIAVWLLGVTFVCTAAGDLPFDAAYNFLAYKNIVDRGAYELQYGATVQPFDPIASTGPTVNLPILFYYWWSGVPDAIYRGTAWTNVAYVAFFLAGFCYLAWRISRNSWLVAASLLLFVYLVYVTPPLVMRETLFSGLGEHFAVVFLFFGTFLIWSGRTLPTFFAGMLCLGLALLTKINAVAGFGLPLVWLAVFGRKRLPQSSSRVRLGLITLGAMALLLAPKLLHSRILPSLLLEGSSRSTYSEPHQNWENGVSKLALYNWRLFERGVKYGHKEHWQKLAENLREKLVTWDSMKGGWRHASGILLLFLASMAFLWRCRRPETDSLFYLGLFGLSFGSWWFLLNHSTIYRYLAMGDLAASIVVAMALPLFAQQVWAQSKGFGPRPSLLILGGLGYSLFVAWPRLNELDYRPYFANTRLRQAALAHFVDEIESLPNDALCFGFGWFQAPEVRAVANVRFASLLEKEDVMAALDSKKPLYFVASISLTETIPTYREKVLPLSAHVIYDREGYALYAIDPKELSEAQPWL